MTIINIIFALEIVFLTYFFASFPRLKIGNFTGIVLSFVLILFTGFHSEIYKFVLNSTKGTLGKITFIFMSIALLILIIYSIVLTFLIFFAQKKRPKSNDVIIILGCRIKATGPTRMLRRRLDTAIEYMKTHKNSICIVSGGQGKDENIAEADAMKSYLINNGIDTNRIIKENKSTSTWENFRFSRDIIDSLGLPRKMIVVTDGFHQFRAGLISKSLEINVTSLPAKTEPRFIFIYWIREILAITKFFIKNK